MRPADGSLPRPRPRPLLGGGDDMGSLIRSFDWSKTPIGPVEQWSPSLRMMVNFLLANRFPLLLWWGPQYVQFITMPIGQYSAPNIPSHWANRPASVVRNLAHSETAD